MFAKLLPIGVFEKLDLKTIYQLVRRHLASTVVVILFFAGAAGVLMAQYKALFDEKEKFSLTVKAFGDERLQFERRKLDEERVLLARKADLDTREFIQKQYDSQYNERLAALKQRASEYESAENHLRQTAESVSHAQRLKNAEDRLQKAISEFSAYGVDISRSPPCDADQRVRYEAAKSKYREARALADASGLTTQYQGFFTDQTSWVTSTCVK